MYKVVQTPFLLLLLLGCTAPRQLDSLSSTASVTILHWNDFHAQNVPFTVTAKTQDGRDTSYLVGGTATLLGYINQFRDSEVNVAVLNAGDDFQGTPISSITYGRSQIELMNIISPDAMTLGNHEFDYGIDSLRANISRATFPIVSANVIDEATSQTLVPAYRVVELSDARLGVIGLAPPDLEILVVKDRIKGIGLRDVDEALDEAVRELRERHNVNLIIVLSHMGLDKDTLLAARRSDIDVIVGGHSHTALFSPIKKNRTIVVQAGSRGRWLGKLDLVVDLRGDSVKSYSGMLVETRVGGVASDPVAAAKVTQMESSVEDALSEVVGTLVTPWVRSWGRRESNIGNFVADAFRAATGTDIGFMNSAGIRKDLAAGPITLRDIWEINPFENTLVTFSVTGEQLRTMMEWQAGIHPREFLQVSGLSYVFDSAKPVGRRLISLSVGGQAVVDTAFYSITTNNYVSGHFGTFFGYEQPATAGTDTGIIDRDAVVDYIRKRGAVRSEIEGRITDISTGT